jgi:4-hydroxy-3-polyprenylbenzoate decarboxylase
MEKPWFIGITGASGVVYGIKLCEFMLSIGKTVHLLITDAGWRVLHDELEWEVTRRQEALEKYFSPATGRLVYHPIQDIGASIASGSFRTEGMVIIPCSMGTLSAIAHGSSDNLLERTADVMLKEGRKLVIVPRETPLHTVHLENMLILARMGVKIIPAMPAFYQRPKSLDELVQFLVGKVLDSLEIEHELFTRWGESQA